MTIFRPGTFENARHDAAAVLEVVGGSAPRFVPLKRTELGGELTGPLASLRLRHRFGYSRAECDAVLEAVYRFPLPGDAAVTAVRVRFGDVEIDATLDDRRDADVEYEAAKQRGDQATLLTRESPDVLSLQVAGIAPDQEVTVETEYVQLARAEGAGWSLRVPLTTAPRYTRGDERGGHHAEGQPLQLFRDPGHRFSLDVRVHGAASVTSSGLPVQTEPDGAALRVRLCAGEVVPDRDLVLEWALHRAPARPSLQVWTHAEADSGRVYFLAAVTPPSDAAEERTLPREVLVLVDHSGSMEGAKWEAADWAVASFLGGLKDDETFNLGLFHTTTRWFSAGPCQARPETVARAIAFLKTHRDSGSTELGVALEQALGMRRQAEAWAWHVLIITDAQVTDAGRLLRLAQQEAQRADRRRISLLCIDSAPNATLAQQLADRGGGTAHFLTSAPEEEDITTALDAILADWARPVAAGLRLAVNRPQLEAGSQEEACGGAIEVGDLPLGRTKWAIGRAAGTGAADLRLRLEDARGEEVATWDAAGPPVVEAGAGLVALFGARRVLGLEYLVHADLGPRELEDELRRLGYDPAHELAAGAGGNKVYAENRRADAFARVRGLLLREALRYRLVCSETAFVAVRRQAGRPVQGSVAVGSALPAGWSDAFATPPGMLARHALRLPALTFAAPATFAKRSAFDRGGVAADTAQQRWQVVVFSGQPHSTGGQAVLFDSTRDLAVHVQSGIIDRLLVGVRGQGPSPAEVDTGLELLVFVEDTTAPRARVRLRDLLRQGGERPLNLRYAAGWRVRIVLADPAGVWTAGGPWLELLLAGRP